MMSLAMLDLCRPLSGWLRSFFRTSARCGVSARASGVVCGPPYPVPGHPTQRQSRAILCDGSIQRGIEDIIVSQPRVRRPPGRIERHRDQEGHALLTETPMRAQPMSSELTEIVILPSRADDGVAIAEDREIPFPVDRQLELLTDRFLIKNQLDAGQGPGKRHHHLDIT